MLTQDAHVVFALLLVCLDEVVKGVREVLEQRVLLVHLQPQDAVQELSDGAVWGRAGRERGPQAVLGALPTPGAAPGRRWGTHPSPRPGSRTWTRALRCQQTAGPASCLRGGRALLTILHPRPLTQAPGASPLPPVSPWCVGEGYLDTNPVTDPSTPNCSGPSCPATPWKNPPSPVPSAHPGRRQSPPQGSPSAGAPCSLSGSGWW